MLSTELITSPFDIAQARRDDASDGQKCTRIGRNGSVVDKLLKLSNEDLANLLIQVGKNQDRGAFKELFLHFAPRVKAYLCKVGCDMAMAEECTQDVMATLWNKAHLFDPTRATVATWVFTIARNRQIDLFRKQRRPEPELLAWGPEEGPDQEEQMQFQQDAEQLNLAMMELPQNQRDLIQKSFFGDMSHREIADATGLPLGTIKSRIRLALEWLRYMMS